MMPRPSKTAQARFAASAASESAFARRYTVLAAVALGAAWSGLAPTLTGLEPEQRGALRVWLAAAAALLVVGGSLSNRGAYGTTSAAALPAEASLPLRGLRRLAGLGSGLGALVSVGWAWYRARTAGTAAAGPEGLALASVLIGLALPWAIGLGYALFRRQSTDSVAAPAPEPELPAGDMSSASGQYAPLPARSLSTEPVAAYVDLHSLSAAGLTLSGWLLCAGYALGVPSTRALGISLLAVAPAIAALALVVARAACSDTARELRALAEELDQMSLRPTGSAPALAEAVAATGQLSQLYATLDDLRAQLNQHIAAYNKELGLAEEADRRRTEFISDVGRELRVPVQALLTDVDRLLRGEDGALSDRQREAADVLHRSATQLQALLAEVFDDAVLEGGLRLGKRAPVNVGGMARELLRLLRPLVSGSPVRLRLQVDPRTPPAFADAVAVRRILGNLVGNAVKFTEQGEIVVAVRPLLAPDTAEAGQAQMVQVQVHDTGPGIARGEVDRMFEEFSQGSTPRRPQVHGGIGLGLAIARRLTELHGGQISATSEPGSGATFTFTLPAAKLSQVNPPEAPGVPAALSVLRKDAPPGALPTGRERRS